MANVAIYSSTDPVVAYRVTQYLESVNTPDYTGEVLVSPDISGLPLDYHYWKVDGTNVVEMSDSDKTATYDFLNAKSIPPKKYCVTQYSSNSVSKEIWYAQDLGDGSYSRKAEESTYGYSGRTIVDKTVATYYWDGSIYQSKVYTYYRNSDGDYISKIA